MKKTIEELKQIIKEELQRILAEQETPDYTDYSALAASPDDTLEEDEELYYENLE